MDRIVLLRWLFWIGAICLMLIIGCKSGERQNPSEVHQSPSSNAPSTAATKYFDGSKACKFLADIQGFDLGAYVPYTNTEGYTCQTIEPSIKLSCNSRSDLLCNSISYQVDGEKEGATSAELFYMGTSLSASAHKTDLKTFSQYSNRLAEQALGVALDAEIMKYINATASFLPMKPEANREAIDRHTLKKNLGSGWVSILARRNDLAGGAAYMIRFTVYPDERWIDK